MKDMLKPNPNESDKEKVPLLVRSGHILEHLDSQNLHHEQANMQPLATLKTKNASFRSHPYSMH
mgnify:CR=1 FL=1